jgi:hypothetical protein
MKIAMLYFSDNVLILYTRVETLLGSCIPSQQHLSDAFTSSANTD